MLESTEEARSSGSFGTHMMWARNRQMKHNPVVARNPLYVRETVDQLLANQHITLIRNRVGEVEAVQYNEDRMAPCHSSLAVAHRGSRGLVFAVPSRASHGREPLGPYARALPDG